MITTVKPSTAFLEKYIDCFYIFEKQGKDVSNYIAFPHFLTGLSFFQKVNVYRDDFAIHIEENENINAYIELLGKYKTPVSVKCAGTFKEISIIFKPFGINRFIKNNYWAVAPDFSQAFTEKNWLDFAQKLGEIEKPIEAIEGFLMDQFVEMEEISSLERSLMYFEKQEEKCTIAAIATKTGFGLKSFQRNFLKHMGCTPIDYRRLKYFRSALNSKLQTQHKKSLTEITFENHYFDQSYFIKEFRNFTNLNPRLFFKKVRMVDGDKIIWELL